MQNGSDYLDKYTPPPPPPSTSADKLDCCLTCSLSACWCIWLYCNTGEPALWLPHTAVCFCLCHGLTLQFCRLDCGFYCNRHLLCPDCCRWDKNAVCAWSWLPLVTAVRTKGVNISCKRERKRKKRATWKHLVIHFGDLLSLQQIFSWSEVELW